MPISIRFRLNPSGATPRLVQYQIRVNGTEAKTRLGLVLDSGDFARLHPKEWDQKAQKARGNSQEAATVNEAITALKTRLNACYRQQQEPYQRAKKAVEAGEAQVLAHPAPVPDSVLYRHLKGQAPWVVASVNAMGFDWAYAQPKETDPTLITLDTDVNHAMRLYIVSMRVNGRRMPTGKMEQPGTLFFTRFEATADLLARFQTVPLSVGRIDAMWADNFHAWMQTQPSGAKGPAQQRIGFGLAARRAAHVREMVGWLHRQKGVLRHNPLAGVKWKGYARKAVDALDEEQFAAFCAVETPDETPALVKWWFMLMAYTGMDYPDAQKYAIDRKAYEVMTPDGLTLQGQRNKNDEPYCVPLIGEMADCVEALFAIHPQGPYQITPQNLNRWLQNFFKPQIGFTKSLTAKIARKTHANILATYGYEMNVTSQSLGHRHVSTTSNFYFRTGVTTVRQGMRRVGSAGK